MIDSEPGQDTFLSHLIELRNRLIAVLDVEGAPVVRAWNVVNTLSKLLSPAAEAFRYFVLERGESYLAENFPAHFMAPDRGTVEN